MDEMDINKEYERIFGISHYPTLYAEGDEEYSILRQEIISRPALYYETSHLPFEDFYLQPQISDPQIAPKIIRFSESPNHNIMGSLHNQINAGIAEIISMLLCNASSKADSEKNSLPDKHVFWITIRDRCKAYGYLDRESNNFFIGEGSLIALDDSEEYKGTSSFRNRHRIIRKYGIILDDYVKLRKEVKCRSAVAAARYVVGALVESDLWIDSNGKKIYEVYPQDSFPNTIFDL